MPRSAVKPQITILLMCTAMASGTCTALVPWFSWARLLRCEHDMNDATLTVKHGGQFYTSVVSNNGNLARMVGKLLNAYHTTKQAFALVRLGGVWDVDDNFESTSRESNLNGRQVIIHSNVDDLKKYLRGFESHYVHLDGGWHYLEFNGGWDLGETETLVTLTSTKEF